MIKKLMKDKIAIISILIITIVCIAGIFAPQLAPHDPNMQDISNKFASFSLQYPLGTDNLGRCVLSRLIY